MSGGVAPAWWDKAFGVFFFVFMPVAAYDQWGGWLGVIGYILLMVGLIAGVRFVSCRVRRVGFWDWDAE